MKKLLTLALAATLGVTSLASAANENVNELSNVQAKDKKITVSLKQGLGKVSLAILDQNGKQLHKRTVNVKHSVEVPYDMSQLPAGQYHVLIANNSTAEKAVYTVETKEAAVTEFPLVAYGNTIDNNAIRLLVVGLEQPGVKVEFFDQDGKRIFKEHVTQEEGFEKIYNLKNLKPEDINIKLTDSKGRIKMLQF
jgi:hypothetical protein